MDLQLRRLTLVAALIGGTGCKTLMFWKSDPETPDSAAEGGTDGGAEGGAKDASPAAMAGVKTSSEENDLKLARVWTRLDELEEETFRLKERMRVLEKGLTLGIAPDEMKAAAKPGKAPRPAPAAPPAHGAAADVADAGGPKKAEGPPAAEGKTPPAADGLAPADDKRYQEIFSKAHELYRAGRFGQAAAEFDKLGDEFGEKVRQGQHLYWIARCWGDLKEYGTARQRYLEFIAGFPASPWAARAKLDLGRIEWRMGLNENAIGRFREVIKSHPLEDAAEMARMELEHLDKSL